jgi:hypothetical protein
MLVEERKQVAGSQLSSAESGSMASGFESRREFRIFVEASL